MCNDFALQVKIPIKDRTTFNCTLQSKIAFFMCLPDDTDPFPMCSSILDRIACTKYTFLYQDRGGSRAQSDRNELFQSQGPDVSALQRKDYKDFQIVSG